MVHRKVLDVGKLYASSVFTSENPVVGQRCHESVAQPFRRIAVQSFAQKTGELLGGMVAV